jgi:aspartyl protease family protein
VPKAPQVSVIGLIGSKAILRIDGQQQMLGKGESRNGVTLLEVVAGEARLDINGRKVSLGMGMDTGGMAARPAGASVEIVMNGAGQFITNGQINGRVVEMLVDTGANTVSMTAEDARAMGIDYRMDGQRGISGTAGGMVVSWVVTLKSVQVGPIVVKNVVATVREAPRISPVLLGMTFLSQVNLQHEQNRLKITAR